MTDDLDEIKVLLKASPPPPAEEKKYTAISSALEAFDKKNAKVRQGTGSGVRLMDTANAVFESIFGRMYMKKAYVIAGSLCLGILATTVLTSTGRFAEMKEAIEKKTATQPQIAVQTTAPSVQADMMAASPPGTPEPSAKEETYEAKAGAPAAELSQQAAPMQKAKMDNRMMVGSAAGVSREMMVMPTPAYDPQPGYYQDEGRDKFQEIKPNPVKLAKEEPVSTFSIDVDTSSYSFTRSSINNGVMPNKDAVRIEEMVNYFPYEYAAPESKAEPFKANVAVFPTPWNSNTKIMHIGIKGYQIEQKEKPHTNLVFLLDTSGSMNAPNKMPLLKSSMKLLLESLKEDDTVALVTYAGSAGVALEPTKVADKAKIINALDNLGTGGSTAGAEGIKQAYQLAEKNFDKNGVNRVILATDGDFNVGISSPDELKKYIEEKRKSGVFLSVLGFGSGNYNDQLMQTLAQNGNGNAAYIDNLNEARKVLVEEAGSTLFTIAKDVKIQVEFNPAEVAEYRLIGYENRLLNREDFNNDKIDAGEIGAGHAVTAIYEITPTNSKARLVDELRYQKEETKAEAKPASNEYAFVKIRYKLPEADTSKLITTPVTPALEFKKIEDAPKDSRFASTVAGFGLLLRGDSYIGNFSYDDVISQAEATKGDDKFGYRAEFINLARLAKTLSGQSAKPEPANKPD